MLLEIDIASPTDGDAGDEKQREPGDVAPHAHTILKIYKQASRCVLSCFLGTRSRGKSLPSRPVRRWQPPLATAGLAAFRTVPRRMVPWASLASSLRTRWLFQTARALDFSY